MDILYKRKELFYVMNNFIYVEKAFFCCREFLYVLFALVTLFYIIDLKCVYFVIILIYRRSRSPDKQIAPNRCF